LILHELTGTENDPLYQALEIANGNRQYDFLKSMVYVAVQANRRLISHTLIKALNFHAIVCLHSSAGGYRPCAVTVGNHQPPEHYRVQALMDDFVDNVNRNWESFDPVVLASFVLWRLNYIHPFINGNGRTARAACYFVLCAKLGGWLPGQPILPELIRHNHAAYVAALQQTDASFAGGVLDLRPLHALISRLLIQQLASLPQIAPPASPAAPTP
jgi:Fic family protein